MLTPYSELLAKAKQREAKEAWDHLYAFFGVHEDQVTGELLAEAEELLTLQGVRDALRVAIVEATERAEYNLAFGDEETQDYVL